MPYQDQRIAPLALNPRGALYFQQYVRIEEVGGDPRVIVEESAYSYFMDAEDEASYVFRYEYTRSPVNNKPHSHFHVNGTHPTIASLDYKRVHIPAGRISLEQILAHLIIEHHVNPKSDQKATLELLRKSHQGFSRRRTDLITAPFP